ncbi:MAG: TatD family hydrolase [Nitrososphaerota archaeon]
MSDITLIDAHCHIAEYEPEEIKSFGKIRIAGVAMDFESSEKTLILADKFKNIDPFVGVHPWNLRQGPVRLKEIRELIADRHPVGLGEVGVDVRFARAPLKEQLEIFEEMCRVAVEFNLPLNVHALGGWDSVIKTSKRLGVRAVLFHWYTGPVELLREIKDSDYFISINPAVRIQPRHMQVLRSADSEILLTESDGPYNYRGLSLSPRNLPSLIEVIAESKNLRPEEVVRIVYENYLRFLGA